MFVNRHIKNQFKILIAAIFKKAKLTEHFIKTFAKGLTKNTIKEN
jgi:hypothetical protein